MSSDSTLFVYMEADGTNCRNLPQVHTLVHKMRIIGDSMSGFFFSERSLWSLPR
ncbi:MAG: hypothetical protein ACLTDF_08695 [Coprococcus sp.]